MYICTPDFTRGKNDCTAQVLLCTYEYCLAAESHDTYVQVLSSSHKPSIKKERYRYYDTVLKHEKKITIIATTIILTALVISIHSITFYSSDFNQ